jgi:hypothetical protein
MDNKISEIEGLENLKKLQVLKIGGNQIDSQLIEKLGGLSEKEFARKPQKFVEYCRKNT